MKVLEVHVFDNCAVAHVHVERDEHCDRGTLLPYFDKTLYRVVSVLTRREHEDGTARILTRVLRKSEPWRFLSFAQARPRARRAM